MPNWRIEDVWNDAVIVARAEREFKPRDYIYASEIGKNYWERYQKMIATPVTNPFDARTLRKFAAGNVFEDLVGTMLSQCGLLISEEEKIETPVTDTMLSVHGRLDKRAGGIVDWDEAKARIEKNDFPQAIKNICLKVVDEFKKKYANGVGVKIFEIKSVNSMLFWAKKDYLQEAYPWHTFQQYTYLRETKERGSIVYISKDDLTIKEIEVECTDELEAAWVKDITEMTEYYRAKKTPPLPPTTVFDERKKYGFSAKRELEKIGTPEEIKKLCQGKVNNLIDISSTYGVKLQGSHETNWEYEWSSYRDLMTGTKNDDEFGAWAAKNRAKAADLNKERKAKFLQIVNQIKNA